MPKACADSDETAWGGESQMMARSALLVLLLACLLFITSDTVVEKTVELPTIASLAPPSIDHDDKGRRSDIVVETKAEVPSAVSLPLPFVVYYAYNEYHTYPKPIDVIADSIAQTPVGSCREEVRRASDIYGLSFPVMMAFALIESSCQPTQKTGSYIGLFQLSRYEFNR